jgi:uncharacterized protein
VGVPGDRATPPTPLTVGVLSDTHGHLYPHVASLLEGVQHIIHAGDVGSAEVLGALRRIAPVTVVRGNVDVGGWADALPSRAEVELRGVTIVVSHISPRPAGAGGDRRPVAGPLVVVSGHSHVAALEWRGEVLYLNPGSAGPRRFGRPRTVARLEIWPPRKGDTGGETGGAPRVTAQILTAEGD